jgi:lipid-A-disaccharide synthase
VARVFISCGEPSGDLYATALAEQLKVIDPSVRVTGLGGERLRAAGAALDADFGGLAVTGLVEALGVLPRSLSVYRRLLRAARAQRPDVFVAVDFPDFNFRLAAAMRRLGVPVVYYIPPQAWAWRRGRLRTIARLADRVLVIFPFEPAIYREAGTTVTFVGHPLVEMAAASPPRQRFLAGIGLDPRRPTLALLPGSRPNEVARILPVLAGALPSIAARVAGVQAVVARAPGLGDAPFARLAAAPCPVRVVERRADDVLASSDAAMTASGTATVQAAIHLCPMVVVYRMAPLTYRLLRPFVRVESIGMVNLVAGARVVPELVQEACTPEAVAGHAVRLLTDAALRSSTRDALREVRTRLGGEGASRQAAEIVLELARRGRPGPGVAPGAAP